VKYPQQNPIIDSELQRPVAGVVVLFGVLLGLQQMVTNVRQERAPVTKEAIDGVSAGCPGSVRQQGWPYTTSNGVVRRAEWYEVL
jgi:hypothetical protein